MNAAIGMILGIVALILLVAAIAAAPIFALPMLIALGALVFVLFGSGARAGRLAARQKVKGSAGMPSTRDASYDPVEAPEERQPTGAAR